MCHKIDAKSAGEREGEREREKEKEKEREKWEGGKGEREGYTCVLIIYAHACTCTCTQIPPCTCMGEMFMYMYMYIHSCLHIAHAVAYSMDRCNIYTHAIMIKGTRNYFKGIAQGLDSTVYIHGASQPTHTWLAFLMITQKCTPTTHTFIVIVHVCTCTHCIIAHL